MNNRLFSTAVVTTSFFSLCAAWGGLDTRQIDGVVEVAMARKAEKLTPAFRAGFEKVSMGVSDLHTARRMLSALSCLTEEDSQHVMEKALGILKDGMGSQARVRIINALAKLPDNESRDQATELVLDYWNSRKVALSETVLVRMVEDAATIQKIHTCPKIQKSVFAQTQQLVLEGMDALLRRGLIMSIPSGEDLLKTHGPIIEGLKSNFHNTGDMWAYVEGISKLKDGSQS